MCLTTFQKNPSVAQEDIPVYKVLLHIDGKFYAPNRYGVDYFQYEKGVNTPLPCESGKDNGEHDIFSGKQEFTAGWLHSYRNSQDAIWLLNRIKISTIIPALPKGSSVVIIRMTIPKDCRYYQSDDTFDYCSKCLMWDGEIISETDLGIE